MDSCRQVIGSSGTADRNMTDWDMKEGDELVSTSDLRSGCSGGEMMLECVEIKTTLKME